jgi:hypothetical protein
MVFPPSWHEQDKPKKLRHQDGILSMAKSKAPKRSTWRPRIWIDNCLFSPVGGVPEADGPCRHGGLQRRQGPELYPPGGLEFELIVAFSPLRRRARSWLTWPQYWTSTMTRTRTWSTWWPRIWINNCLFSPVGGMPEVDGPGRYSGLQRRQGPDLDPPPGCLGFELITSFSTL